MCVWHQVYDRRRWTRRGVRTNSGAAALAGALLPILHALQEEFGYIDDAMIPLIAEALNISHAEVHGVISFYHDFRRAPAGKHVLRICRAESCQSMGCNSLIEHVEKSLGVKLGETTADGNFTLEAGLLSGELRVVAGGDAGWAALWAGVGGVADSLIEECADGERESLCSRRFVGAVDGGGRGGAGDRERAAGCHCGSQRFARHVLAGAVGRSGDSARARGLWAGYGGRGAGVDSSADFWKASRIRCAWGLPKRFRISKSRSG